MRPRSDWKLPAVSLIGVGIGIAAGVAAGLLTAPMRGAEMRRSLRARMPRRGNSFLGASDAPRTESLSATLGEIAQMHSSDDVLPYEARS